MVWFWFSKIVCLGVSLCGKCETILDKQFDINVPCFCFKFLVITVFSDGMEPTILYLHYIINRMLPVL